MVVVAVGAVGVVVDGGVVVVGVVAGGGVVVTRVASWPYWFLVFVVGSIAIVFYWVRLASNKNCSPTRWCATSLQ